MTYVTVNTDVEVDIADFDDDVLKKEMALRGLTCYAVEDIITDIFHKRRLGQDYQQELDNLIYESIGRIS